ncbi:uncharacterized protein THITE_2041902 [Thermothielavioides terrestris NRRL 8126]|uniref:Methyltransferase domain-containing protein n=1 Tax=Thermothielavioides terrestris (strain ATCC 38088 / NRRL 8126) TaxID=578455 RepID=G2QT53_THETT|nr:uncharacterized protein THITE_2041902 [Thermothielavioides terrestris NRRL 8126]AEO64379.1 hypothetical protein THITE_2041902 [Thermothielavioides terrestris NRRL 8126]
MLEALRETAKPPLTTNRSPALPPSFASASSLAPSSNSTLTTTDSSASADAGTSGDAASMTSSVREHVFEGGLRYHAYRAGKYAFPNDESEQIRDDLKHANSLLLSGGKYFFSPVEDALEAGGEVLDLGTGTGIWAVELGDKYPKTKITGIDLSPIQPTLVPENVHFFVDDFEEEWIDPEDKYDLIHLRNTLHSVKDPQALLERAIRHLKPGGYFEASDICFIPRSDDGTLTPSTPYALRDFISYIAAGVRALGSDVYAVLALPDAMRGAGFADVRRATLKLPLGPWPRDPRLRCCGLLTRTVMMEGLRGVSARPLAALGWTPLQIEMFLVDVRKALMDESVHVYFELHVVYGKKPER